MSDILSKPVPRTAAEYRTAIEQLLGEMDNSNRNMERNRRDIEQLKAESDTLKAETRAILSTMGASF